MHEHFTFQKEYIYIKLTKKALTKPNNNKKRKKEEEANIRTSLMFYKSDFWSHQRLKEDVRVY